MRKSDVNVHVYFQKNSQDVYKVHCMKKGLCSFNNIGVAFCKVREPALAMFATQHEEIIFLSTYSCIVKTLN